MGTRTAQGVTKSFELTASEHLTRERAPSAQESQRKRVAQRRPQPVRTNKQGKSRQHSRTYATQNNPSEQDCGQGVVPVPTAETSCLSTWTWWRIDTPQPARAMENPRSAKLPAGPGNVLHLSRSSGTVILVEPNRDNRKVSVTFVAERQKAMKEAPKRVESDNAARSVGGSHSVRISSVHHDRCRPGGGRSVTPSSTQLVTLGRLLHFG